MNADFPLSLPNGTEAVSLPWEDDHGWVVEAKTDRAAAVTWAFGKTSFGRHLCLHRFKLWWLRPSHGKSGLDIPPETAFFLAERHPQQQQQQHEQQYVALLPVSDTHARASLHRAGDEVIDGRKVAPMGITEHQDPSALAVSADTGDPSTRLPDTLAVVLVGTGPDPFRLAKKLVREATERLRAQLASSNDEAEETGVNTIIAGGAGRSARETDGGDGDPDGVGGEGEEASVASFVDAFGWCTWDSFYTMVSPEGILEGLSTLHKGGARPRWVIIDDGWQHTTNDDAVNPNQWGERLVGLEANKRFRRFDEMGNVVLDLGDTVGKIKRDYGVHQVLAWHAMSGYWGGVEPEAAEMAPFDPRVKKLLAPKGIRKVDPEMQPELDEKRFGMVSTTRVEAFYLAYHRYLKDNGIDGIKVDAQSLLDCMGEGSGGAPAVTRAYHDGLIRSVEASFKKGARPAALIHCMCHAPTVLFHACCVSKDRVIIRGSDDFWPREDLSHGPHLYSNAFNALLLSNLGVQDWDMFQTGLGLQGGGEGQADDAYPDAAGLAGSVGARASWLHAAARAISGGPVYVSDRPGQHNRDILAKLVLEDGSVLRASTNALPTADCLMRDPQQEDGGLLQIWALNKVPGTAVVGSFNIKGSCFSLAEHTWVRTEGDSLHGQTSPSGGGGGGGQATKGTVSPSDVHSFRRTNSRQGDAKAYGEGQSTQPGCGNDGESNTEHGVDGEKGVCCCYAVYLHCRQEARLVRLHETVSIEVPPLGYELATFSRITELRLRPLGGDSSSNSSTAEQQQQHADATPDGRRGKEKDGNAVVSWATLGLSEMFNSSAAVTAQETTFQPTLPNNASLKNLGEGDFDHGGGGGLVPGVALTIKGSGIFSAVASRKPARAILTLVPGRHAQLGISWDGRSDKNPDADGVPRVLEVHFTALAVGEGRSTAPQERGNMNEGMGLVRVDIPGPWEGCERRLVFWWEG